MVTKGGILMTFLALHVVRAAARARAAAAEVLVFLWTAAVLGFALLVMALYFFD
jgi:hypothetical protein